MDKPKVKGTGKGALFGAAAFAALLIVQMDGRTAANVPPPRPAAMLTLDLSFDLGVAGAALRLSL